LQQDRDESRSLVAGGEPERVEDVVEMRHRSRVDAERPCPACARPEPAVALPEPPEKRRDEDEDGAAADRRPHALCPRLARTLDRHRRHARMLTTLAGAG